MMTDPKGQEFNFEFDVMDRLTRQSMPEGANTYSYDAAGRLTEAINYSGNRIQLSYDPSDRVTQVIQTLSGASPITIGYTYDANGNRTGMMTPWGTFSYEFDSLNRLTRITNPQAKTFTFSYDALSRRTRLTLPNGIQADYVYDSSSQLSQIVYRRISDNAAVAFNNYTYDQVGNRLTMTDLNGTHFYEYDDLRRLISAQHPPSSKLGTKHETFSYDTVGNRASDAHVSGYVYNAADRLIENSSFTYQYDANGSLISKQHKTTGQITSYIYDSENMLRQVNIAGTPVLEYQYDSVGRRVARTAGGASSNFVYDNENLLATLAPGNSITQMYTFSDNIDEPLSFSDSNLSNYYFLRDILGNVIGITDESGNVVESAEYDTFGRPVFVNGEGVSAGVSFVGSQFSFTSREFEPVTGEYYFRSRQTYDPLIGRFGQEDAITTDIGHESRYLYAHGAPTNFVDPQGGIPVPVLVLAVPVLTGAALGGIVDIALQLAIHKGNTACINWDQAKWAAIVGGALGLLGPEGFIFGRTGAKAIEAGLRPLLTSRFLFKNKPMLYIANVFKRARLGWSGSEFGQSFSFRGTWLKDLASKNVVVKWLFPGKNPHADFFTIRGTGPWGNFERFVYGAHAGAAGGAVTAAGANQNTMCGCQ